MEEWNDVKSSHISHIGYNHEEQTLSVKFHTGPVYVYAGVHPVVFKEFLAAESPGKYFQSNVRNIFETKRIYSDVK